MGVAPRAVVFDLDGTLADTLPDVAAALNAALADAGYPALALEDVGRMLGGGALKLAERALAAAAVQIGAAAIEALHLGFLEAYAAAPCNLTRLYPGTAAEIDRLRGRGWRIGVCTNKPHDVAVPLVDALGLGGLVDGIVGGSEALPLKPDPAMLKAVISSIGGTPGRSVMVGDSSADVGAARALAIPSVVLAHGYSSAPVGSLGATCVLAGIAGIADLVDTLVAP